MFFTLGRNRISGPGLLSLGVPGVPWHTQILADQLTLFQPGGTDNALLITTGTPGFSDLPTALWPEKHLALGPIPKPIPDVQLYLKIGGDFATVQCF